MQYVKNYINDVQVLALGFKKTVIQIIRKIKHDLIGKFWWTYYNIIRVSFSFTGRILNVMILQIVVLSRYKFSCILILA